MSSISKHKNSPTDTSGVPATGTQNSPAGPDDFSKKINKYKLQKYISLDPLPFRFLAAL